MSGGRAVPATIPVIDVGCGAVLGTTLDDGNAVVGSAVGDGSDSRAVKAWIVSTTITSSTPTPPPMTASRCQTGVADAPRFRLGRCGGRLERVGGGVRLGGEIRDIAVLP